MKTNVFIDFKTIRKALSRFNNMNNTAEHAAAEPWSDDMAAMAAYMASHNYSNADYAIYSNDPEWIRLNAALID